MRPARLLVAVAQLDRREPRAYLCGVLRGLGEVGVEIQVMAFDDGPALADLEQVADVRRVPELPPRSPSGLVQSVARRLGGGLDDRVHDARTRETLDWIAPPDALHVHGPLAATVLRYVRDPDVPVTTYVHPHDFSIAGLQPLDRTRLLARTDRFLVAHAATDPGADARPDLLAAGVDAGSIEDAPTELAFPDLPPAAEARARARAPFGLPPDGVVVAMPPAPGWVDWPDLTLALAWELRRRGGAEAPHLLWYGMDLDEDRRWPIDLDIERMGLTNLHLTDADLGVEDLCLLAEAIVLPEPPHLALPDSFVADARARYTPVLCWADDPLAEDVARWPGVEVARPDVAAMADRVLDLACETPARRAARQQPWSEVLAEVTRLTGLEVPVP